MKKIALALTMLLTIGSTLWVEKASAATDWTYLSAGSSSGKTLQTGYYYVTNDVTFSNGDGRSGLTIASGADVHIYIPQGVTLTARGGNANGQTGAGAGIELPQGSSLYLEGSGRVVAQGGNAANGGNGGNGGNATGYDGDWTKTGAGGNGGNGGGGAGAGIGTRGGAGGNGGSGGSSQNDDCSNEISGTNGTAGSAGATASAMGNLYVVTSFVNLSVTGGNAGSSGSGGGRGRGYAYDGYSNNYTVAGGGGGGAGGFGGAASNIGTGGPGGGGGGGGAGGAQDKRANSKGGVYDVTAYGGKGGKNGNGTSAADGAEAPTTGTACNEGWVTVENGGFGSDWNPASGAVTFGNGGSGGDRGSSSVSRPLKYSFEIKYNVLEQWNGSAATSATVGYQSNTNQGQITVTVPTTYSLGLTAQDKYVDTWYDNDDGTGTTMAAYDTRSISSGTKNVYAVWKNYKDVFPEGNGTIDKPFVIESARLLALTEYVNAGGNTKNVYFKQSGDIRIADVLSNTGSGDTWDPIGHTRIFEGDYDGGGYIISKAKVANAGKAVGIFGKVLGNVHNLGAEEVTISTSDESVRAGAIAGMLVRHDTELTQAGRISNCYSARNSITAPYAGCLVGEMEEASSISYCHETGNALQGSHAASIASKIHSTAKVDKCFIGGSTPSADGYSNATNLTTGISATRMASGEIAWLLNDKTAMGVTWYQDLADQTHPDAYPVLDKDSNPVYYADGKYSNQALGLYTLPGTGTADAPLLISSAQDMQRIADYCSEGNKTTGIYFLLTTDIDLTGVTWKPIGSAEGVYAFDGVFDGGGHTVAGGNITADTFAGVFGVVTGKVTRLCVENTTAKYAKVDGRSGGIAARIGGSAEISNCLVKGCHVENNGLRGVAGGIASDMSGLSVIRNCLVVNTTLSATRIGYICSDTKSGTQIMRCYTDGPAVTSNDSYGNVTNSYNNESELTLASGEITFNLNNRSNEEHTWFQTIGKDATPVLSDEHGMVFLVDGVYTNDYMDIARLGDGTEQNPYKIANAKDLEDVIVSIAIMKRSDFYVKQTADIDLQDSLMAPIGTATNGFEGHYDGDGHVIRNANVRSYQGNLVGLFNGISGTVERLGIENCTFVADANTTRIGAFAGKMTGQGVLRNCYVRNSTIDYNKTPGVAVGGLVGEQADNSRIESCYGYRNTVVGQDDGKKHYGHIVGYIGANASANLVFTDGPTLCAEGQSGSQNMSASERSVVDARFKSGEICYLLSGSQSNSPAWHQTIKTDSVPTLSDGQQTVYRYTLSEQTMYTNSKEVPQMVSCMLYNNDGTNAVKSLQIYRDDERYYAPSFKLEPYALDRQYYYFAGWNTMANGKGTFYPYNAELRPTDHLSLYAVWQMTVPSNNRTNTVQLPSDTIFFKVFDNGGYNKPYGQSYKGKLTLVAPKNSVLRLTGTVSTEALASTGKPTDYMTVYDGDDKSKVKLTNAQAKRGDSYSDVFFSTTNGTKEDIGRLMSTGEKMTIEFITDKQNNYTGLDLMVAVIPKEVRALGQGTAEDPFLVADYSDLTTVDDYIRLTGDSKIYIQQTDDIDLEDEDFTPLAASVGSFEGHYDGGGHIISNLKMDEVEGLSIGLFSNVSGTVEHLGIENSTFAAVTDGARVGTFAGRLTGNGQLRHCYAMDNSIAVGEAADAVAGALVGEQADASTIESCYGYHNEVDGTADSQQTDGAVAGEMSATATQRLVFTDKTTADYNFRSGEVAYQLNSVLGDSIVWYQTIGTDNLPLFDDSSETVYRHETLGATGYTNEEESDLVTSQIVDIFTGDTLTVNAFKGSLANMANLIAEHRHFVFKGWNTEADGSGMAYPKDTILLYNEPLKLYTQYDMVVNMSADDSEQIVQAVPQFVPFAKVYDDGGKDSTYSAGTRYVTLTAPESSVLQVTGTVASQAADADGSRPQEWLAIYDGNSQTDLKNSQRLGNANGKSGEGWQHLYYSNKAGEPCDIGTLSTSGREMTIVFHTDSQNGTDYAGIDLTVVAVPVDSAVMALGKGTEDAPYMVTTAADLKNLAAYSRLSGSNAYFAQQQADIDMQGLAVEQLATDALPFAGHYDGGGYSISNMTIDDSQATSVGLFGTVGGVVERIGIVNSTVKAAANEASAGVLAGRLTGNGALRYSYVAGSTVTLAGSEGVAGALVGELADNASIESCYGYHNVAADSLIGRTSATATQRLVFTDGADMTDEKFTMGEACYLLNGSQSDSAVWRQTLGTDSLPVADDRHGVVYRHLFGDDVVYSNSVTIETVKLHMVNVFDSNAGKDVDVLKGSYKSLTDLSVAHNSYVLTGWNTAANGSGTAYALDGTVWVDGDVTLYSQWKLEAEGTSDHPHMVATSADLKDLAEYVYLTGKSDFYVRQARGIDMTDVTMRPIGSGAHPFSGVYDGGGHAISNVKIQSTAENLTTGIFGHLSGTVTRLGVENATIEGVNDNARIGAIAGRLSGSGTITYCYVKDSKITSDIISVAGAIVGDMSEKATIKSCFAYNNTLKASRTAYICGDMGDGTAIIRCFTDGDALTSQADNSQLVDCAQGLTDANFKSGKVCYLLNGSQGENTVWRQIIGFDSLPIVSEIHFAVYRWYREDLPQTKYTNSPEKPEEVNIVLNHNDGSGLTSGVVAYRQQYDFESEAEFTLSGINYKDAYSSKIVGWSKTADGSDATRFVQPYSDMTLYAVWDSLAFLIPYTGEKEIQIPQSVTTLKVYDQEGPNGRYQDNFNGTLRLTVPEKKVMLISGTVNTESTNWLRRPTDYLTVSDENGKLTNDYASKSNNEEYNGLYYSDNSGVAKSIGTLATSGNKVALTFVSDGSNIYDGVDLTIKVTDPIFYINDKADFVALAGIKGDVYLNQDIDLGEWSRGDLDVNGNFDGNGHTITYTGSNKCTGLFRTVSSGASLKHLRVSANMTTSSKECAGIALSNEGTISDCHFRGEIRNTSWLSCNLAGIALKGNGKGLIDHCTATGELNKRFDRGEVYQIGNPSANNIQECTWLDRYAAGDQILTDKAMAAQAQYPVYARSILDVTKPEIVIGEETLLLYGNNVPQGITIRDGQRFSCPSDLQLSQITYVRQGTNGAYEPWVLPFDYTVDADMFQSGVEFYRFEKSPMGDIQTVQIKSGETYQVAANEPLAFRTTGSEEYTFNMKYVQNGSNQPQTIRIPADGTSATLASGNDIARIKVTYEGISADRTASEMMYIWDDSKGDFVLADGTTALQPFRYYLQYIDKATSNYEHYEDTDWARMEANGASAPAMAMRHAARRAPLSQLTTEGWQPIILDPRGSQEVTAKMLEDYEIMGLWDLYDEASAPGTDDNTYAVSVIYVPVEEGTTLPYAVPLLVRAKHADAEPLVTEGMGREIDALLTEAEAQMSEEEVDAAFDEIHYWCATFGGRYDVWQFAVPEKDSLLNEYGALAFTAGTNGPQFTRVPAADTSTMQHMSYCFTAYDVKTFENLPLVSDRIQIVVLDPSELTGIKSVNGSGSPYGRSGRSYNLRGQKVGDSYRGIVIKNGRKILNK